MDFHSFLLTAHPNFHLVLSSLFVEYGCGQSLNPVKCYYWFEYIRNFPRLRFCSESRLWRISHTLPLRLSNYIDMIFLLERVTENAKIHHTHYFSLHQYQLWRMRAAFFTVPSWKNKICLIAGIPFRRGIQTTNIFRFIVSLYLHHTSQTAFSCTYFWLHNMEKVIISGRI